MKKHMIIGSVSLVISILCIAIFIISGFANLPSGPESVVNRYEKAIKKGNLKKYLEVTGLKDTGAAALLTTSDIPYFDENPNVVFGKFEEEVPNSAGVVTYAVVYEKEDGKKVYRIHDTDVYKNGKWYMSEW